MTLSEWFTEATEDEKTAFAREFAEIVKMLKGLEYIRVMVR